jgi:hypothetical protein
LSTLKAKKVVLSESEFESDSEYQSDSVASDRSLIETESDTELVNAITKRPRLEERDELVEEVTTAHQSPVAAVEPEPEITPQQFQPRRRHTPKPKAPKVNLHDIHPDLKNVWEDLDSTPLYDTSNQGQPQHVLVKLLPFQLEGLS